MVFLRAGVITQWIKLHSHEHLSLCFQNKNSMYMEASASNPSANRHIPGPHWLARLAGRANPGSLKNHVPKIR